MNTALIDELELLYPGATMREVFALAREALALRSATRVRVTAEEPPTCEGQVLALPAYANAWIILDAFIVEKCPRAYPQWIPLPERPE